MTNVVTAALIGYAMWGSATNAQLVISVTNAPIYCMEQVVDVQVVTNVVTANNEVRSPHRFCWGIGEQEKVVVIHPATEKTETAEAVEIKTLSFEWEGQTHTVRHERVLWIKARRWLKSETWKLEE